MGRGQGFHIEDYGRVGSWRMHASLPDLSREVGAFQDRRASVKNDTETQKKHTQKVQGAMSSPHLKHEVGGEMRKQRTAMGKHDGNQTMKDLRCLLSSLKVIF